MPLLRCRTAKYYGLKLRDIAVVEVDWLGQQGGDVAPADEVVRGVSPHRDWRMGTVRVGARLLCGSRWESATRVGVKLSKEQKGAAIR